MKFRFLAFVVAIGCGAVHSPVTMEAEDEILSVEDTYEYFLSEETADVRQDAQDSQELYEDVSYLDHGLIEHQSVIEEFEELEEPNGADSLADAAPIEEGNDNIEEGMTVSDLVASPDIAESGPAEDLPNTPLKWFVLLEESFETSEWTATGLWHRVHGPQMPIDIWAAPPYEYVSLEAPLTISAPKHGQYAYWYGDDTNGSYIGVPYFDPDKPEGPGSGGTSDQPHSGTLTSPLLDLSLCEDATLAFWSWWEIESMHPSHYDLSLVEVSIDEGASWSEVFRMNPAYDPISPSPPIPFTVNGMGAKPSWTFRKVNLTAFVGKKLMIRFVFDTVDSLYNGFRGWLIDELRIECAGRLP